MTELLALLQGACITRHVYKNAMTTNSGKENTTSQFLRTQQQFCFKVGTRASYYEEKGEEVYVVPISPEL